MSKPTSSAGRTRPYAGPLTPKMVPDLLGRFGELIENHPSSIIDISQLPAIKLIMIQAFKSAWMSNNDHNLRNWIRTGWLLLSSFQYSFGKNPVGCDIAGMKSEEAAHLLERYVDLAKRCQAESEILLASLTAFKAANAS